MTVTTTEISGQIQRINESDGMGAKGAWHRWEFVIDDKKYGTFDEKIGKAFKVGEFVSVTLEQKPGSKYVNLVKIVKVDKDSLVSNAPTQAQGTTSSNNHQTENNSFHKSPEFHHADFHHEPAPARDFHLSIEQSRISAVELSFKIYDILGHKPGSIEELLAVSKRVLRWIVDGEIFIEEKK
jgi:hypothetical protein